MHQRFLTSFISKVEGDEMNNILVETFEAKGIKFAIYQTPAGEFRLYVGHFHRATKATLKGARGYAAGIVKAN